ncbi:hypothetical protein Tco_0096680 [Tanacetum coccineum]
MTSPYPTPPFTVPSPSESSFSIPTTFEPVFSVATTEPVYESQTSHSAQTSQNNQPQFQQYNSTTVSSSNAKFPYLKKDKYETWAMKMEYWIMNSDHNLSMIGSLMYLTASRPDIMFLVSAYSRHQYPRDSPFVLEAYSDSDYAGSNGDRKSTTGGCQFLGRRLISWQCKKQTVVATSSTEAEYVAVAHCCGQLNLFFFHVYGMCGFGLIFCSNAILDVCIAWSVCGFSLMRSIPSGWICVITGVARVSTSAEIGVGSSVDVWTDQQEWVVHSWKLFPFSSVHVLETFSGKILYMFVDTLYPLSVSLMKKMLKHKLEVEVDGVGNDMTYVVQLIQFIKNQLATCVPSA